MSKQPSQRSGEGDARREAIQQIDRVLRGREKEMILKIRRSQKGHIYVDSYVRDDS